MDISFSNLGGVIREIREILGITQGELCNGICTQSHMSKIENGDVIPNAVTMYMISLRLGIDTSSIFNLTASHSIDFQINFFYNIRKLIRKKEYEKVLRMIKREEHNPAFNHDTHQQFLKWNKAICTYHISGKPKESIKMLQEALHLTLQHKKFHNNQEISILNSIGVIYFENKEYRNAVKVHEETLNNIKKSPFKKNLVKEQIRIYYNLAKAKTHMREFEVSVQTCEKGIHLCLDHEILYLLGELYYQVGYNYYLTTQVEECCAYFQKAIHIFNITEQQSYISYIEKLVKEVKEDSQPTHFDTE
ncbi:helix-turn-helix domain-containing protein [Pontibacillus salicampi]|uniref:Helix-turn-helix domain-containing protein n=1 Tax=Pontibacillus salicampi TaxID=1449801 RepID=A0ABV6LMG1_9BACI